MMPHDKKGIVSIIMGKMEKPKMEEEKDISNEEAKQEAAKEIMSALEQKDAAMLAEALRSFMEMCKYESEDED